MPEYQPGSSCCQRAAPPDQQQAQKQACRRQHTADTAAVGGGSKGMGQAGIFGQRKTGHRQPGKRPFQGKCHPHAESGSRGGFNGSTKPQRGHKIAAQPNDGESTAVRVCQNGLFFDRIGAAGQGVAGIGITVQMNAPGDEHRPQAKPRRPQQHRQRHRLTEQRPGIPDPAADSPDQRKSTHGIAHVALIPLGLRQRQGTEHAESHRNGFKHKHTRMVPFPCNRRGIPP